MILRGRKVRAVNPGGVFPDERNEFRYTMIWETGDGKFLRISPELYSTASAAKQAMRENVAQERAHHSVTTH